MVKRESLIQRETKVIAVSCAIAAIVLTTWLSGAIGGLAFAVLMFEMGIPILGIIAVIFAAFVGLFGFLYIVVAIDKYDIEDSDLSNKIVDRYLGGRNR